MAGLSAGALDREVVIQELTEASSDFPVETWTELDVVFMAKQSLSGRERFRASQLSASYDSRWDLHYREDMDPDLVNVPKTRRLVYRGRVYDIVAAEEIGRQEGVALYTLASTDEGSDE